MTLCFSSSLRFAPWKIVHALAKIHEFCRFLRSKLALKAEASTVNQIKGTNGWLKAVWRLSAAQSLLSKYLIY